jgi:hypothetical protein
MRVDLGKDRWAEVVDADDMPHAVQVAVNKLMPKLDLGHPEDTSRFTPEWLNASQDTMLAHVIIGWSFDQPVPGGDPAGLAFLPHTAHKALVVATYEHWEALGFSSPRSDEPNESSTGSSSTSGSETTSSASSPKGAKPAPAAS